MNTLLYTSEVITCPNCGENMYDGVCQDSKFCGYGHDIDCGIENYLKKTKEVIFNPKEKENKNFRFLSGNYESYSITLNKDKKIESIKFCFIDYKGRKHKFEICLNSYLFEEREYNVDNSGNYTILKLKDLNIGKIAKKTKVGYGEYKEKINYFSYLGLNYRDCSDFIEKLLKDYHLNN